MDKKEIAKYWVKSSDNDFATMNYLFKGKNYPCALKNLPAKMSLK